MDRLAAVAQVATAFFTRNPSRLDEIEQVIERVARALSKVPGDGEEGAPTSAEPPLFKEPNGPSPASDAGARLPSPVVAAPVPASADPAPIEAAATVETVAPVPAKEVLKPAVPIEESITDEFLICLEDGRKLQTLKRHLKAVYNMTPLQYIRRWGLDPNYPMVSPAYSRMRSRVAKEAGLGRRPRGGNQDE